MAPITLQTANAAYDKAVTKLKKACVSLDLAIPPPAVPETEEVPTDRPQVQAAPRGNSVSGCALCVAELEALDPGAREGHACTHAQDGVVNNDDVEVRSTTGSESADTSGRSTYPRRRIQRKPRVSVIREYMEVLENCLDTFTDSVANLCSVIPSENEQARITYAGAGRWGKVRG